MAIGTNQVGKEQAQHGSEQAVPGSEWDVDIDTLEAMLEEHARLTSALRDTIAGLDHSDNDRWVGLDVDGKFAVGQSLDAVVDRLKEQGAEDGTFVVEFLSAEPMEVDPVMVGRFENSHPLAPVWSSHLG